MRDTRKPSESDTGSLWRRRSLLRLLPFAALLVVLGVAFSRTNRAAATRAPRAWSRDFASDPSAPTSPPQRPAWTEGCNLRYAFAVERQVRVEFGQAAPDLRSSFSGELSIDVVSTSPTGSLLSMGAEAVSVGFAAASGDGPMGDCRELGRCMDGEVLVRLGPLGQIEDVAFPAEMDGVGRDHWREMLAHWLVVYGADPTAGAWETVEADATGIYRASYVREGADPDRISKTKGPYLKINGRGMLLASTKVDARAEIVLDPLLVRAEGRESLSLLSEQGPRIESEVRFRIERIGCGAAGPARTVTASDRQWSRLDDTPVAEASEPKPRCTLGEAIEHVRQAGAHPDPQLEYEALRDLVELLRADPDANRAVETEVRRFDLAAESAAILTGALAAAGTEAAQQSLLALVGDQELGEDRRMTALLAVALVEHPTADFEPLLRGLHGSGGRLSASALLVLGAVGGRLTGAGRARIEAYVTRTLARADVDTDMWLTALEAIGNLGPSKTPPAVTAAFRSDAPGVRAAAVRAVRRTEDAAARGLREAALRDSDSGVRIAALDSLVEGERPGAAEALEAALSDEAPDEVREHARHMVRHRSADQG